MKVQLALEVLFILLIEQNSKFYHALTQETELIFWFLLIIYFILLYIIVTTNRCRTSLKLKSDKINDAENVYLEREDFYKYEYEIENMIEFNNLIIANSGDSLIILNV